MDDLTLPTPSVNVASVALTQLPAGTVVDDHIRWDGTRWTLSKTIDVTQLSSGNTVGDIIKWDGAKWYIAAGPVAATFQSETCNAGTPDVTKNLIIIYTAGAVTLANGTTNGQEIMFLKGDADPQTVTPISPYGFIDVVFSNLGEIATFMWSTTANGWVLKSARGPIETL